MLYEGICFWTRKRQEPCTPGFGKSAQNVFKMSRGRSRQAPGKMSRKCPGGRPKCPENVRKMSPGHFENASRTFSRPKRRPKGGGGFAAAPLVVSLRVLKMSLKHFQNAPGHFPDIFWTLGRPTGHFLDIFPGACRERPRDIFQTFWVDFQDPGL